MLINMFSGRFFWEALVPHDHLICPTFWWAPECSIWEEKPALTFGPNSETRTKVLQLRTMTAVRQNWRGGLWDVSKDPATPRPLHRVTAATDWARASLWTEGSTSCLDQMFQAKKHPRPWAWITQTSAGVRNPSIHPFILSLPRTQRCCLWLQTRGQEALFSVTM